MVSTRSRPCASPATSTDRLPPSSWASNADHYHNRVSILVDDDEITAPSVSDLDPETDRLLPTRRLRRQRQHRVRIQGRVALVRAVSVADLRQANANASANANYNPNANAKGKNRAGSLRTDAHTRTRTHTHTHAGKGTRTNRGDVPFVVVAGTDDCYDHDEDEDGDDDDRVVEACDSGFRGYGIGGAGNIRMHETSLFFFPSFLLGKKKKKSLLLIPNLLPCFIIRFREAQVPYVHACTFMSVTCLLHVFLSNTHTSPLLSRCHPPTTLLA